jgi:hypothetical protein
VRIILIVNQSTVVTAAELAAAVAAIQSQIDNEFGTAYGASATLTIGSDNTAVERIYIMDDTTQADALGYHQLTNDVPVGFCFAKTCIDVGDNWQSCLDHEVLEQIMDPGCTLGAVTMVDGKVASLDYEVCDAVENDEYMGIGDVPLSNFVLPAWFEPAPTGLKYDYDFLGKLTAPATLDTGGYFGYTISLKLWKEVTGKLQPEHQKTPGKYDRRMRRHRKRARAGVPMPKKLAA